jgi:hypothetical protein
MKAHKIAYAQAAQDDLQRPSEFLLDTDDNLAERAIDHIDSAIQAISHHPFTCCKAADGQLGPY